MKKHPLTFGACLLIGACSFFVSCQKNDEVINPSLDSGIVPEELHQVQDRLSGDFARLLASSVENEDMRKFIKSEAIKQFDGDYNVLLAAVVDQPTGNPSSRTGEPQTFRELFTENTKSASRTNLDLGSLLDSLLKIYPTLQMSIPELDELSVEDWDAESEPLWVAIIDSEYDDTSTETLAAYDAQGDVHFLDANNAPDELVIVVRPSESLVAIPLDSIMSDNSNGRVSKIDPCGDPFLISPDHAFYTYDAVYNTNCDGPDDPGDGDPGDGDGSTPIPCERSASSRLDYINKAKFLSKDKLRDVEDWALGKPDMYVIHVNVNIYSGFPTFQSRTINIGKEGWYTSNLFGGIKDLKEKNIDKNTNFLFEKSLHGYQTYYYWLERDVNVNFHTRAWYISSSFDPEDWSSSEYINGHAISGTSYASDDFAGHAEVGYIDTVCGEGRKYSTNTGHLYFYVNHQ